MFAVIKTGGKQYKVVEDQVIVIEKLAGEAGDTIAFDDVMALGDDTDRKIGSPSIAGAGVTGTIVEQRLGDKVIVFKKKRRQNYRRKRGHRQNETLVRITGIVASGFDKEAAVKAAPSKPKGKTETAPAAEAADAAAETASKKTSVAGKAPVKTSAAKTKATKASAAKTSKSRKKAAKSAKTAPKAKK